MRNLPPEQFCNHGFVIGKASEAGLGNELYKILTAAALSVMLNRSLIIGQTRHIGSLSSLSVCWILFDISLRKREEKSEEYTSCSVHVCLHRAR